MSPAGTDEQGFLNSDARCDPGRPAAAMGSTTQTELVLCQTGPGAFYYRGVRLSDGALIALANAVRSAGGYDVTNPADGTRYEIRPHRLTLRLTDVSRRAGNHGGRLADTHQLTADSVLEHDHAEQAGSEQA